MHKAEVVLIEGASFRNREATERAELRAQKRRGKSKKPGEVPNAESADPS